MTSITPRLRKIVPTLGMLAAVAVVASALAPTNVAANGSLADRLRATQLELEQTRRKFIYTYQSKRAAIRALRSINKHSREPRIRNTAHRAIRRTLNLSLEHSLPRVATKLMPYHVYRDLTSDLQLGSRRADAVKRLRRFAGQYRVFSHQVSDILSLLTNERNKLQLAKMLFPRVVDVENWRSVYAHLSHRSRLRAWVQANSHLVGPQMRWHARYGMWKSDPSGPQPRTHTATR